MREGQREEQRSRISQQQGPGKKREVQKDMFFQEFSQDIKEGRVC